MARLRSSIEMIKVYINPEGNYHILMSLEKQIKNNIKIIKESKRFIKYERY